MAKPQPKLPYEPASMTVIVIDDQDPIRKAIHRLLTSMGFGKVLEYFDGSDALKAIAKEQLVVDLVITDLYMRKTSGFQVLKKIRSQTYGADIPVIIVTGEGSKEDIVKAADLGADDYLLKPFQISDVEKKIGVVLNKYHSPPPLLKLIRQGERSMIEGQFQDALKLFEAAARLDPTSARAIYCKALALDKMGHAADALTLLKGSAEANSTYYRNFTAMADIYLKTGQKHHAIEALRSELELNPKQPQRQCLVADMLHNEGDYLGAIEHYRIALKENAKLKDALVGMGRALDANDNQEKAIYYYRRARRHHPDFTRALDLIVRSFEMRGETKKAIPILIDEIQQAPHRVDARLIVSQLLLKFEEIEKALKIIDDGLIREPQSIPLLKGKARVLLGANDPANAAAIYQRVIALEPTSQHFTLLGMALMHDRQYKPALQAFQTALKESSDLQRVYTLIADVYKRSGNILQAITMLSLAKKTKGGTIAPEVLENDIRQLMQNVRERRAPGRAKTPKAS